eukprot:4497336-Pyramimonas_sp.AAC.1
MLREHMLMDQEDGGNQASARREGEGADGTRQLQYLQEHGCAAGPVPESAGLCGQVERQHAVVQCSQLPRRPGRGQEPRLPARTSLPRRVAVEGPRRSCAVKSVGAQVQSRLGGAGDCPGELPQ